VEKEKPVVDGEGHFNEQIDPWDYAYITSYVGNIESGAYVYKFRAAGVPISVPPGSALVGLSPCSAILKTADKAYQLSCRNQ